MPILVDYRGNTSMHLSNSVHSSPTPSKSNNRKSRVLEGGCIIYKICTYKAEKRRSTLLELSETKRLYFLDPLVVGLSRTLSGLWFIKGCTNFPLTHKVISVSNSLCKAVHCHLKLQTMAEFGKGKTRQRQEITAKESSCFKFTTDFPDSGIPFSISTFETNEAELLASSIFRLL